MPGIAQSVGKGDRWTSARQSAHLPLCLSAHLEQFCPFSLAGLESIVLMYIHASVQRPESGVECGRLHCPLSPDGKGL